MSMEYIRKTYGVPAKRGMRVTRDGRPGVITGSGSTYVRVRFDGWNHSRPCHPTWRMEYHEATQKELGDE